MEAGQQVRAALHAVIEPELGRPITGLGFVAGVAIDDGQVHVRLRAPSYFDVRRYGWLVLADARAAVGALGWVEAADAVFSDAGGRYGPRDAGGTPSAEARDAIRRAAFLARQHRLVRDLLDHGLRRSEVSRLLLSDLPATADTAVYLQRRAELGLAVQPRSPLVVTEDGRPVRSEDMDDYLARLRAAVAGEGPGTV